MRLVYKSMTQNPIWIFPVSLSINNSLSFTVPWQVFFEQNNDPPAILTSSLFLF